MLTRDPLFHLKHRPDPLGISQSELTYECLLQVCYLGIECTHFFHCLLVQLRNMDNGVALIIFLILSFFDRCNQLIFQLPFCFFLQRTVDTLTLYFKEQWNLNYGASHQYKKRNIESRRGKKKKEWMKYAIALISKHCKTQGVIYSSEEKEKYK